MTIQIDCSTCGAHHSLIDNFAGLTIKCPKCQTTLNIPEFIIEENIEKNQSIFEGDKYLLQWRTESFFEKLFIFPSGQRFWSLLFHRPRIFFRNALAIFVGMIEIFLLIISLGFLRQGFLRIANYESNEPVLFVRYSSTFLRNLLAILLGIIVGFILMMVMGYLTKQIIGATHEPHPFIFIVGFLSFFAGIFITVFFTSAKRSIKFYRDQSRKELAFQIVQDRNFNILYKNYRYKLEDQDKQILASFHRNYAFRKKQWDCYDLNDNLLYSVKDKTKKFVNTDFIFVKENTDTIFGELIFMDNYLIDLTKDISKEINQEIAIALAVLIDMEEHH